MLTAATTRDNLGQDRVNPVQNRAFVFTPREVLLPGTRFTGAF